MLLAKRIPEGLHPVFNCRRGVFIRETGEVELRHAYHNRIQSGRGLP